MSFAYYVGGIFVVSPTQHCQELQPFGMVEALASLLVAYKYKYKYNAEYN